ncbi:tetratricopeptide repeat protein [uncultured Microbulbifer sp.]|uniref:tetratricopeptide repeat protein n=1 Tax=uncultured Microbulbifer sp. TaxID=348147 RepID=UPI0025E866EC|nr:tetratricopeptide repeat protein [uncultured Microbulbifer sp.]
MRILRATKPILRPLVFVLLSALASPLLAETADDSVQALQRQWAQIQYRTPEKERADKLGALTRQAQAATERFPQSAAVWTWSGIIRASHAGAIRGLSALSIVKAARSDLERAIEIDGSALDGAAYTSLGSLYYHVPGWPIGFGDDKKARTYLLKGLEYGAQDVDANYFYADYLFQQKDYTQALDYAGRAEKIPADPQRPLASEGRLGEIKNLQAKIQKKLH